MQNDSQYEMPADKLVFTHERLRASRELGEVEIVNTIWGAAKVRVVHKQENSGLTWLLSISAVLVAISIIWHLYANSQTESSESQPLATQPTSAQKVSEEPATAQNLPETPTASAPPISGPATAAMADQVMSPVPSKPAAEGAEKPSIPADQPRIASPKQKKVAAETRAQTKPNIAPSRGRSQPPSGQSTTNSDAHDRSAVQTGSSGTNADLHSPAEAATAPAHADTAVNPPPLKVEPAKSDVTDSKP